MIKARYLDLIVPNSNQLINTDDLPKHIQSVWHSRQSSYKLNQFDVKLGSFSQFYTSKFRPVIQRISYFLTVNNKNADEDNSLIEPTLSDFKAFLSMIADVSFYIPRKAFRIYLVGSSLDIDTIQRNLTSQWIGANNQCNKIMNFFQIFII